MKIIGFFYDGKPLLFQENVTFFRNISNYDLVHLWKMCDQNFIENQKEQYVEIIQSVFSKYKTTEENISYDCGGRILEFDISSSMYDCLAYEETNGFYDECDCPPPEFWIAYFDDKIFSYIPDKYLENANLGVEISMSESLRWLKCIS